MATIIALLRDPDKFVWAVDLIIVVMCGLVVPGLMLITRRRG